MNSAIADEIVRDKKLKRYQLWFETGLFDKSKLVKSCKICPAR